MIVLMAAEREAKPLGRVSDYEFRNIGDGGLRERLQQRFHAVAAELCHHQLKRLVIHTGYERERFRLARQVFFELFAPGRAAFISERRVQVVSRGLDPATQCRAARAGKGFALTCPVFQGHHFPACGLEDVVEPVEHALMRGRIEALAVIVDNPPGVADIVLVTLDQGFIDIALVQLRVAHKGDETALLILGEPAA